MATKHSEDFKGEAVRIATHSGLTRRQVASDLGIGSSTLGKWMRAYSTDPTAAEDAELRRDMILLTHIREQHRLSLGSYGRPRMTQELNELGIHVGQRRVARIMRDNGIQVLPSRKRVAAYSRDGLSALFGQDIQNSRSRRIGPDELCLRSRTNHNYLTPERPTIADVVDDVNRAFRVENHHRKAPIEQEQNGEYAGQKTSYLALPSRETIRREIKLLDTFEVVASRHGLEAARKKFAPVGMGLNMTRPLERVEMDVWKVDLRTIMATGGIWSILSDEEKAVFGLEVGKKTRWFLMAAMCRTTRCIPAMKLARVESGRAAVQTTDMIVRDKGLWADAVGALTPWSMSGTPELIVTDAGSGFIHLDTRAGATDLGINIDNGPAGMPEFRATIERVFGTMAGSFIGRFTGRTFSNTVVKSDYDSDKRAALTSEELSEALVRCVVDVKHRRPHAGLGGKTPLNCWNRLVEKYGVAPMPSLERRGKAMGTRTKSTVSKSDAPHRTIEAPAVNSNDYRDAGGARGVRRCAPPDGPDESPMRLRKSMSR